MFFLFNETAPTETYTYGHTLSLHDALPISHGQRARYAHHPRQVVLRRRADGRRRPRDRSRLFLAHRGERTLAVPGCAQARRRRRRSEEHTSELQSLMRISYAVFCLKKKKNKDISKHYTTHTTRNT